ncbi:hypothetical protein ANN_27015 [Periplaneta americana]|uniref:Mos1 transposase HTH domain-containing protein n=1 Tax=Periplaneta americana TaxID=6978 RepID=A0ABQ8RWV6_PERAM|nr:hypothetical protein ANN_27015 [Periplaneta americana]
MGIRCGLVDKASPRRAESPGSNSGVGENFSPFHYSFMVLNDRQRTNNVVEALIEEIYFLPTELSGCSLCAVLLNVVFADGMCRAEYMIREARIVAMSNVGPKTAVIFDDQSLRGIKEYQCMGPVPTQHRDALGELRLIAKIRFRKPAITAVSACGREASSRLVGLGPSWAAAPLIISDKNRIVDIRTQSRLVPVAWQQWSEMEALIPSPAACEVRSVIKFFNAQSIAPIEIRRQLCQVYGPNIMSKQMVRRWCRQFSEGRQSVHDEERSGRPSLINDDRVEVVRQCIMENRRFTITELSSHFPQI